MDIQQKQFYETQNTSIKNLKIINDQEQNTFFPEKTEDFVINNTTPSKKRIYKNQKESDKKRKRVKERSIKYVREKVQEWRRLHKINKSTQTLDQIAKQIGISRKSLDDYSLQLKKGILYGFEFSKKQRMGTLRKFVKDFELKNNIKKNLRHQNNKISNDQSKTKFEQIPSEIQQDPICKIQIYQDVDFFFNFDESKDHMGFKGFAHLDNF